MRTVTHGSYTHAVGRAAAHTAGDFDRGYTGRTWRDYRALLSTVIRYSEPGEILDLGAGLGLFVECAQRYGVRAVGLEPSADGIARAAERGVELVEGDLAETLPFADDRFSAAVMNQVIEHLDPDVLPHALREARRVLAQGAPLLVFAPTRYRREPWREETHANLMGPRSVRAALRAAGFSDVRSLAFGAGGLGSRLSPLAFAVPVLPSSTSCIGFAA